MGKSTTELCRPFREVRARVVLKLLPACLSDIHAAVLRELSAMLLRIEPTIGGVPLTVKRIKIDGNSGAIFEDQPHIHLNVVASFLLFAPESGQLLSGVVNNVADDTIGLLILDTFNAVIPKDQLPDGFSFNHKKSTWTNDKLGHSVTVGSEVLFRCTGMRTTDQGLIQVLASFEDMGKLEGSSEQQAKRALKSSSEIHALKNELIAPALTEAGKKKKSKSPQKAQSAEENATSTKESRKKKREEPAVVVNEAAAERPASSRTKKAKTKS